MYVLGIGTSQLSKLHEWELLPNVDKILQRSYPSYNSGFNDEHNPGQVASGYLYDADAKICWNQTAILEETIRKGDYIAKGYFVILASQKGCIAVVSSKGDHLLKLLPPGQKTTVERRKASDVYERAQQQRQQQEEDLRWEAQRMAEYEANQRRVNELQNEKAELQRQLSTLQHNSQSDYWAANNQYESIYGAQNLRKRIGEIDSLIYKIDQRQSNCSIS